MIDLLNEAQRRRAIAWAISLTANTPLEPQHYERILLERYARGKLTIDQVVQHLEGQVQHVLYRSQEAQAFSESQLAELLSESQAWNQEHGITGLLCYEDGHFVQLLEGDATQVHLLYDRIRRDPRHRQVRTLSDAAGPARLFPDWHMAFVAAAGGELEWVLAGIEARNGPKSMSRLSVRDPHLITLLTAFSELT